MNNEIKKEIPLKQLIDLAPKLNCHINVFLAENKWVLCHNETGEEVVFEVSLDESGENVTAKILEERGMENNG